MGLNPQSRRSADRYDLRHARKKNLILIYMVKALKLYYPGVNTIGSGTLDLRSGRVS